MKTEGTIDSVSTQPKNGVAKKVIALAVFLGVAGAGVGYWQSCKGKIETDNAFIDGEIYAVASKIPGTIAHVHVRDGQVVKQGDLLVTIDPQDASARVRGAQAALDLAVNQNKVEDAEISTAAAGVESVRARLLQAKKDFERSAALVERGVIPRERFEKAETEKLVAERQLQEAIGRLERARAAGGIATSKPGALIRQRAAALAEAEHALSYTKLYAPADGYIAKKTAKDGEVIQPGQALMAVVDLDDVWVTANFKERQIREMKVGQRVVFSVDAYPGRTFSGKIEHISAGTGSAFALLPPENATGNYVKVVQRVPVKISVDRSSNPEHLLKVGMSVVPTVLVDPSNASR